MGEDVTTSLEVSHLVWEASTSSNHFIQVEKHTIHERMHPSFVEVSWSSSCDGYVE